MFFAANDVIAPVDAVRGAGPRAGVVPVRQVLLDRGDRVGRGVGVADEHGAPADVERGAGQRVGRPGSPLIVNVPFEVQRVGQRVTAGVVERDRVVAAVAVDREAGGVVDRDCAGVVPIDQSTCRPSESWESVIASAPAVSVDRVEQRDDLVNLAGEAPARVTEQQADVGRAAVGDEQIRPAVAVDVGDGNGLGVIRWRNVWARWNVPLPLPRMTDGVPAEFRFVRRGRACRRR